jgi:rhamnose transport system ATP-binding protein
VGDVLAFNDVHKSFGAVRALKGVSFEVSAGETHACVGENGAGKSTLLRILAGLVKPDRGAITWRGAPLHFATPRDALVAGVGMVHQERLFFPNLSIAANIFAGHEIVDSLRRLDERAMRARAAALLEQLHVPASPDVRMEHLSPAHIQLVQVARALAFDCRLLVLDEPTTALTDGEAKHLFDVLVSLKGRGVTILFVSHRLPEVFRLCDRITVLRDGEYVTTFDREMTTVDAVVRAMVGREPPERVPRDRSETAGPPALSVRGLARSPRVNGVSFEVAPGEIVGIFGLVGSGRSELLETIFGLAVPDSGTVNVHGVRLAPGRSASAIRAGVALVPEDRQQQGLFFNLTVQDNVTLPSAALASHRYISDASDRQRADAQVQALAIKLPNLAAMPDRLSGGNQQKIVVAKWLATTPRVLLLDEPTKGVDVGAKFEIHNIVRREASRGMACVVASSDLPEVLALADRILVLRDGAIQGELAGAEADEASVMRLAASRAERSA